MPAIVNVSDETTARLECKAGVTVMKTVAARHAVPGFCCTFEKDGDKITVLTPTIFLTYKE